ncbi:MAG: hypothetical protein LBP21_00065 [Synergistaceae bacterium]|jgi:hypothetical protein|nr:hypothetical protein [Synergistaceae bacterium]
MEQWPVSWEKIMLTFVDINVFVRLFAVADSYIAVSAINIKADNIATFNKKHFAKLGAKLYPIELRLD